MLLAIKVTIERFTQEWFPGVVECSFVDAAGKAHLFEEKVPVVTTEDLTAQSTYPRDGILACLPIARRVTADGREIVTVDTEQPWGIESKTGQTRFDVFHDQLVEFSHGAG
jgi:hypothetical protein